MNIYKCFKKKKKNWNAKLNISETYMKRLNIPQIIKKDNTLMKKVGKY